MLPIFLGWLPLHWDYHEMIPVKMNQMEIYLRNPVIIDCKTTTKHNITADVNIRGDALFMPGKAASI